MASSFRRAADIELFFRQLTCGNSKSGKTWQSLYIATYCLGAWRDAGLDVRNGRIAVIDSHSGQSALYKDEFDFDICELEQYSPESYQAAMANAYEQGYGFLIVDSISDAWTGAGGLLEREMNLVKSGSYKNTWSAFNEITPVHKKFIRGFASYPGHVIATVRAKTKWTSDQINGRTVPRKVGEGPEQRPDCEYEFDSFCQIDQDHAMSFQARGTRLAGRLGDKVFEKDQINEVARIVAEFIVCAPAASGNRHGVTFDQVRRLKKLGSDLLKMDERNWLRVLKEYRLDSFDDATPKQVESMEAMVTQKFEAIKAAEEAKREAVSSKA